MSKCASCKYITFDVVRGDRCSITGKQAKNGKYCKNYDMLGKTEEESIKTNNFKMLRVIENNKR